MEDQKATVRIVDIARVANVSVGTVDRVIHNRGKVSEAKRLAVENVLKEINYKPNMIARSLASKRKMNFVALIPAYNPNSYWEKVYHGIQKAAEELKDFYVSVEVICFDQYERATLEILLSQLEKKEMDGLIIATLFENTVLKIASIMDLRTIPYVFIDASLPNQNNLAYYGSNSFDSGRVAASLILNHLQNEDDLLCIQFVTKKGALSLQGEMRKMGCLERLKNSPYQGTIYDLILDSRSQENHSELLQKALLEHPRTKGIIVFNSRIAEIASYLSPIDHKQLKLVGYDYVPSNLEWMKKGFVSYLIGQRPDVQGYNSIKALSNHLLLAQTITKENFMPIDILIPENINYYNNFNI